MYSMILGKMIAEISSICTVHVGICTSMINHCDSFLGLSMILNGSTTTCLAETGLDAYREKIRVATLFIAIKSQQQ